MLKRFCYVFFKNRKLYILTENSLYMLKNYIDPKIFIFQRLKRLKCKCLTNKTRLRRLSKTENIFKGIGSYEKIDDS